MDNEIKLNGKWLIPDTNEELTGIIYINRRKKQILLKLFSLASQECLIAPIKAFGHVDIIKGQIDTGGHILLYDCTFGGQHNRIGQDTTVTVTVRAAFWNLDVDQKEDLCFQKVRIDFGEIIEWSGLCSFEWEFLGDTEGEGLIWKHEKDVEFKINDNVSLKIAAQMGSMSMWSFEKECTVKQNVYMYLEYQTATLWNDILRDIQILNNLLTLGMNRAVYIDEIHYYHQSHQDERFPELINDMEAVLGDGRNGKTSIRPGGYDYLFDLSNLVETDYECLRNWYNKYDKMRPVVELYEASYNFPGISAEMLFLNLVQALETYHARFVCDDLKQYIRLVDNFLRETYDLAEDAEWTDLAGSYREILIAQDEKRSKAIVLKSRLGYLFLARFQYIFSYLGYKMTKFIDLVVDTRNYYTHYSQAKEDKIFPRDELPYVNGILMGVLQYYILQEIGLPMEQIKEKVGRLISSVMQSYHIMKRA